MSKLTKLIASSLLLAFLWQARPFLMGAFTGLSIRRTPLTASDVDNRVLEVGLSGSTYHSLAWSLDASGLDFTVAVGFDVGGTTVWVDLDELNNDDANPYTTTTNSGILPLVLPVAQKLRVTISGSAAGSVIVLDS